MFVAQGAAQTLQHLTVDRLGLIELFLGLEQVAQVAERDQSVRVFVAQLAAPALKPLPEASALFS